MIDALSLRERFLRIAGQCGASLAGIASARSLRESPSYVACGKCSLPESTRSVLVIALHHAESDLELDYWGGKGGTRGNLQLTRISCEVAAQGNRELAIQACPMEYPPEPNGTFLKDAAVLAGLGVIGRNNLLVTLQFGPRVRFAALSVGAELPPSCATEFSPCAACETVCQARCPQNAFAQGTYDRNACMRQMSADELRTAKGSDGYRVAYCRNCELACPAGRA